MQWYGFFLPVAPVSIGWTWLINSILNCGENIPEKNPKNPFAYLHKDTFINSNHKSIWPASIMCKILSDYGCIKM